MTTNTLPHRAFLVDYLQMLAAMAVGMVVLGPLSMRLVHHAGAEGEMLAMVTSMAVATVAWMGWRRHGLRPIVEMTVVMYASVAVLFPFYWLGVLGPNALMVLGHVLMVVGMAIAIPRTRRSRATRADRRHGTRSW